MHLLSRAHGRIPSTKINLIAIGASATIALFAAAAHAALPEPMTRMLRETGVPESAVSLYVRELGQSAPLIEHRARTAMNPASTMKIATTLVGLDVLKPDFTWKTQFLSNASINGGVLNGALVIKGSGDPKFLREHLEAAIRALRERGIREIRGDVLLDRSRFGKAIHDPSLFDGQALRPYNVGSDALLFNFKSVGFKFSVLPDKSVSVVTDGVPPDGLTISNSLRLGGGSCTDWRAKTGASFDTQGNRASATFSGAYSADCGEKDWYVSLFDHTGLLAGTFARLWRDAGGTWSGVMRDGATPKNARVLHVHSSAPLASMVTDINKFSNNVMARQLLLTIDAEISKRPALAKRGGQSVREWAKQRGFELPDLVIENGSGLSRVERISAQSMGALLEFGLTAPYASDFVSSLPLAATDGTLAKRFVNQLAEGRAYLKTGTLTGVKALAGYLLLPDDRKVLYVAFINHANAESAQRALDAGVDWVFQSQAPRLPQGQIKAEAMAK